MEERYQTLRELCKDLYMPKGKMADEYLFTIYATDLFFFEQNIGTMDISDGFTDGKGDGGIDFLCSDDETLHLIQGKTSKSLTTEEIKNIFLKMRDTVTNFDHNKVSEYSEKLKSAFSNEYDKLDDNKNIELVLFTQTSLNGHMRKRILEYANSDCSLNRFEIKLYDENDIKTREAMLFSNSGLIEEDSVEMALDNRGTKNVLFYRDSGIIVSIKASSIRNLYLKYSKKGLFSYNLREHINSQKSVDDAIDNTIAKEKDNFWFYNNGITIGCENFSQDGNKIKLYQFSIINGAQTTTTIGKSSRINDQDYDFAVVCKIVRAEESLSQNSDFISRISEASNSQKAITLRDLRANAIEQKRLQTDCANNGRYPLAIEIKRGVRPANYNAVQEKWQRIKNDYLGQLIYACILQYPTLAMSAKNSIFESNDIYNRVFKRKHDCNTLYDLARISNSYDEFRAGRKAEDIDVDMRAIIQYGKLTTMGVLAYIIKKKRGVLNNAEDSEALHGDNLNGFLITDYPGDDLESVLNELFDFIISKLNALYIQYQPSMKFTSQANFFKSRPVYDLVLHMVDDMEKNKFEKARLAEYAKIFTEKKN